MRNKEELFEGLLKAMSERLDDEKNSNKGDFPSLISEIKAGMLEETREVLSEMNPFPIDRNYSRLREELADLANYCAFGIRICNERLKMKG